MAKKRRHPRRTRRQIVISTIAQKLGISYEAVTTDLRLAGHSDEIAGTLGKRFKQTIPSLPDMTVGQLLDEIRL